MGKTKTRGNGQGTAIRRGNTWTACVVIGWKVQDDPSKPKVPIRRTKGGFATKKDAINYCPALLAGGHKRPAEAPRLSSYWKTYSEEDMLKLAKNTQSAYRTAWNKLKPIHDLRTDAITIDILRKAVSDSCHSYDTAKDCKDLLANLFKMAASEQFAVRDLPSYITLPEHEEAERIPFNADEQKALWKAYDNGDIRTAKHLLMIYTGMMPGEAQKLKVENIDLENKIIVRSGMKTKVRKKTPIVLADVILPVVEDLIAHAMPSGYIWKQDDKKWYEDYYAVLEENGCRRLTPYSCRHTTATALAIDNNIAPHTIKKVMRWSTAKMLDKYAHADQNDALNAVNQIKKPE